MPANRLRYPENVPRFSAPNPPDVSLPLPPTGPERRTVRALPPEPSNPVQAMAAQRIAILEEPTQMVAATAAILMIFYHSAISRNSLATLWASA